MSDGVPRDLSRRELLKSVAAAGASLGLAHELAGSRPPNKLVTLSELPYVSGTSS